MALTECRDCGQEISASAARCPECGGIQNVEAVAVVVLGFFGLLAAVAYFVLSPVL